MLSIVIAAGLWFAAGFRLWRWFQRPSSWLARATAEALVATAFSFTSDVPGFAVLVGRVWPNLSELTKVMGMIAAAFAIDRMVRALTTRRERPTLGWLVLMVVVGLTTVLFFAAGRHPQVAGDAFTENYAQTVDFALARSLATAYAVTLFGRAAVGALTRRRQAGVRYGLIVLGVGATVLCAYGLARLAYLGLANLPTPVVSSSLFKVGTVLSRLGLVTLAVGVVVVPLQAWTRWRRVRSSLLAIWRLATGQVPAVVLPAPWLLPAELRTERMVVEVLDALIVMANAQSGQTPPGESNTSARGIALWAAGASATEGHAAPHLRDLRTPAGLSDLSWVQAISAELEKVA